MSRVLERGEGEYVREKTSLRDSRATFEVCTEYTNGGFAFGSIPYELMGKELYTHTNKSKDKLKKDFLFLLFNEFKEGGIGRWCTSLIGK